jgi:hypothetical protein
MNFTLMRRLPMGHTPLGPTFPFLARVVCVGWGRERIYLHLKTHYFPLG